MAGLAQRALHTLFTWTFWKGRRNLVFFVVPGKYFELNKGTYHGSSIPRRRSNSH